ncbi:dicarboxylate/amino acid:cation symporter [Altererythrobacter sp.]|uniref:dicarboxylate/amino acid:cation symporter n=1 Tax=Altererythrobacter sp. TaxID=1872480 RepID=UPI003D04310E
MSDTAAQRFELIDIRLPVGWTFAGLVAGLVLGMLLSANASIELVLAVTEPVATLWLRALQMTIIPLVGALLVLGITQMAQAARAGAAARRMLGLVFAVLILSGLIAAIFMPMLLAIFPVPDAAAEVFARSELADQQVPGIGEFLTSLIAPNIFAAAAETNMLPLTVFFALLAVAITRLEQAQRGSLLGLFHALANAMLMIIGWVLWLAPIGVFALALGVASRAGADGAFVTLGHYILTVSAMGLLVLLGAYLLVWLLGRVNLLQFARAMVPTQAVALSTQSSLASLPAMLDSTNRLGFRQSTSEFVLPLAVAIFRATSPAMNMAVAIYVAHLAGVELSPVVLVGGILVALIISVGSVSLPGSISFVVSIGPIALAMGVPIEPLALLVAVEMLPDIMRTLGNVTMNVALTGAIDRVGAKQQN